MNVQCSICLELIKGQNDENIYSTKCGHVFHYMCLVTWIKKSATCPDCRIPITTRSIFKLYLFTEKNTSPAENKSTVQIRQLQKSIEKLQQTFNKMDEKFDKAASELIDVQKRAAALGTTYNLGKGNHK